MEGGREGRNRRKRENRMKMKCERNKPVACKRDHGSNKKGQVQTKHLFIYQPLMVHQQVIMHMLRSYTISQVQ